jgi:Delta3-Delta2-enoyl-CoA isomerase
VSLSYRLEDGIAAIHLDDGKANVMSTDWFHALGEHLDRAAKDEAQAVLFRGRDGMFSGGLDMKWLPTLKGDAARELVETFSSAMLRIWSLPIPTVAAVTGHAVAGGCVLASACDLRFAADGPYRIQMNEVLAGMAMPSWAAVICQSAFPVPYANELLLLGRPFSPAEARRIGVVHGLAPSPAECAQQARVAAQGLAAIGSRPYAITKARLRGAEVERVKALLFDE